MKIIFYVSSHGFGHMGRSIPLIAELLKREEVEQLYVRCAAAHLAFLRKNVTEGREKLICQEEETDVGYVSIPGTMEFDCENTESQVEAYTLTWPDRIYRETQFLTENQIDRAVIDIVPWAFPACLKAGVKSIFISNFAWPDIYQQYYDEGLLTPYKACYRQADLALLYALPTPGLEKYFRRTKQVSFVCRSFDGERVEQIRSMHKKPMVYVSAGKGACLADSIPVQGLPFDFIVTEGVRLVGDNVTMLSREVADTHNYIKACDYVISKAGWGTIAEAMLAQKKMALISRPTVAEDSNSIQQLMDMGLCIEVTENELQNMAEIIERLSEMPAPDFSPCQNDLLKICDEILNN